jgi:cell division protein FtsW
MNAIHNGGFFGTGIGNGQIKMGFLSDVHTDFILAGITEETGFMGVLMVIFLILLLVLRILRIAINIETKTEDDYRYKLFAVGIAILISLETILNSLGIIGLLPLKGLPVPFVSYGGSSIIAFSIGVGMVLMISKKVQIGDKD